MKETKTVMKSNDGAVKSVREPARAESPPPAAESEKRVEAKPVARTIRRAIQIADSLSRPRDGAPLSGPTEKGDAQWLTSGSVVSAEGGAVTSAHANGGSACHTVPAIRGVLTLRAEMNLTGVKTCGVVGFGRDIGANIFRNGHVLLVIGASGGYEITAPRSKKRMLANGKIPRFAGDAFHSLRLDYDTEARTVTARVDDRLLIERARVDIGADTLPTQAGFRLNGPLKPGVARVRNYSVELSPRALVIEPVTPLDFFASSGRTAVLRFEAVGPGLDGGLPLAISDYRGADVARVKATVAGDGTLEARIDLPEGYYEVRRPGERQRFGVAVLGERAGKADPFFGIDSAITQLEQRGEIREALSAALGRCGISMARERLSLGRVDLKSGKGNWYARTSQKLRRQYASAGVKVLEIAYGSPADSYDKLTAYPTRDLGAFSRAWSAVGKKWGDTWGGVEVWNEPDHGSIPGDQYMATLKAAAYAQRSSGSGALLGGGVWTGVMPADHHEACAANGILDFSDFVSFHTYAPPRGLEGLVGAYRAWMEKAGRPGVPIWITEAGLPWTIGPGRAPQDEDARTALAVSALAVEAKATGVAVFCPFVLVFYEEGGLKSFSMVGREATPMRSMAAYATCVRMLANRRYVGDLTAMPKPVEKARVFRSGDSAVAVLYTGRVAANATVDLGGLEPLEVRGADGRILELAGNAAPVPDGLTYLVLNADAIAGRLSTETTAMALTRAAARKPRPVAVPPPFVVNFEPGHTDARRTASRYLVGADVARKLPITVSIHNLSSDEIRVTPELKLPRGRSFPSATVVLPPRGKTGVSWTVDAFGALDPVQTRYIVVKARSKTRGEAFTSLPFRVQADLDSLLPRYRRLERLPIHDLRRWVHNTVGHAKLRMTSPGEGQWKGSLTFGSAGGRWAYPKFRMTGKVELGSMNGFVARIRIKRWSNPVAMMLWQRGKRGGFWINDLVPADGKWHAVYAPFNDFVPMPDHPDMQNAVLDPDAIATLAIGMQTRSNKADNEIEVSHLYVVGVDGE